MNKKLMAVAVAGALSVPGMALAQVQIGGSINLLYYQHDPKNGASSKSDIAELAEPELYIRAEEKLGGGMSVWMQCASSFDVLGAAAEGLCSRNSAIGMKGGFGNVFFGNWDQPQKLVFNQARGWFSGTNALFGGSANLLFGGSASGVSNPVQSVTASPVIGGTTGAATANSANAERFYRRQANTLNYHSPNWGGFTLQGSYSADRESTGRPESSTLSPRMYGLAGNFNMGGLWVGVGYEAHEDWNAANTTVGTGASQYGGGSDTNFTVGVAYRFGFGLSLRGVYSESEYEVSNTGNMKVKGYGMYSDWRIAGPHTVRLAYVLGESPTGNTSQNVGVYRAPAGATVDAGGENFTLAYSYAFSKRTEGSIAYNEMKNDARGTFSLGKSAATVGGKQTAMGIVLRHRF